MKLIVWLLVSLAILLFLVCVVFIYLRRRAVVQYEKLKAQVGPLPTSSNTDRHPQLKTDGEKAGVAIQRSSERAGVDYAAEN